MRKRFNRAAICSSDHYRDSKVKHYEFLKEQHEHFKEMIISGELVIDTPIIKKGRITPQYKTIRVFGKEMRVTIEEYNTHCKHLGL